MDHIVDYLIRSDSNLFVLYGPSTVLLNIFKVASSDLVILLKRWRSWFTSSSSENFSLLFKQSMEQPRNVHFHFLQNAFLAIAWFDNNLLVNFLELWVTAKQIHSWLWTTRTKNIHYLTYSFKQHKIWHEERLKRKCLGHSMTTTGGPFLIKDF